MHVLEGISWKCLYNKKELGLILLQYIRGSACFMVTLSLFFYISGRNCLSINIIAEKYTREPNPPLPPTPAPLHDHKMSVDQGQVFTNTNDAS
jgi:hypothetical protein